MSTWMHNRFDRGVGGGWSCTAARFCLLCTSFSSDAIVLVGMGLCCDHAFKKILGEVGCQRVATVLAHVGPDPQTQVLQKFALFVGQFCLLGALALGKMAADCDRHSINDEPM